MNRRRNYRLRRPLFGVVLALGVALAVAACGGSSGNGITAKSPSAIVAAAGKAFAGVRSLHVSGTVHSSGRTIALNMSIVSGKGARGTVVLGGQTVQIVTVNQNLYLKAGASFWRHYAGSLGSLLAGKWLAVPESSGSVASFSGLLDLNTLVGRLLQAAGSSGLHKAKQITIDGQGAIGVTKGDGSVVYVATTGKPYPLELVSRGGGAVYLRAYNQPVSLAVPSPVVKLPGS
jgi:hypothetical protein